MGAKTVITRPKSGPERRRDIALSLEEIVMSQLERLKVQASQHLLDHTETNLLKTLIATLPALDVPEEQAPPLAPMSKENLLALAKKTQA